MAARTSSERREQSSESGNSLEISLHVVELPVSYFSTLLRVVQAALREVAKNGEGTRQAFSQQTQPILFMSMNSCAETLSLRFHFVDPTSDQPMDDISEQSFYALMERFLDYVKALPQRDLWGESTTGGISPAFGTEVERRIDQVRRELRRISKATIRFREPFSPT
ncbi:MAG: hypothetical protein IIC21_01610 [Chloroflexi bacterium]|nr:hypothetical protein [Chloroflexota bacterium]